MIAQFLKTGDLYMILDAKLEMKDPSTQKWIRAVSYKRYKTYNPETKELEKPSEDIAERVFVREFEDFNQKFKLCLDL